MKSMLTLALLMLCAVAQAQKHEVNVPTYVRFTIADPEFSDKRNDPLFDTLKIDRKKNVASYEHLGMQMEPCLGSFYCLSTMLITVAIPQRCDQVSSDGSWHYGKRRFRVMDQIDRLEKNPKQIKYVIEGLGEDGKRESVSVYSQRGLESFAVVDPTGGHRTLVHYYLSSQEGALAGGCVRKKAAE